MTGNELDEILSSDDDIVVTDNQEGTPKEPETKEPEQANAETQETETKVEEPETADTGDEGNVDPNENSTVPQAALHAARQKERESREENQSLRDQLQQMQGQMNVLMQQRQPQPAQTEPEEKPDFWENPDDFVSHKLNPVQKQMRQQQESFSRMMAEKEHGKEVVQEAYQNLGTAMQTNPAAQHEYQRIMASAHPYEELVAWNTSQKNQQLVGNDPQKWFEAEFEKRLADPASQAKILEKIKGDVTAQNTSQTPNVQMPPSISNISGSGTTVEDNDMSDVALFDNALK